MEGYTPSTVEFLLFGLTQGFPVQFQGDVNLEQLRF